MKSKFSLVLRSPACISSLIVGLLLITYAANNDFYARAFLKTETKLASSVASAAIASMAKTAVINSKQLKVTKSEPATWQDCSSNPVETGVCKPKNYSGWRVTVEGEGLRWIYYAQKNGQVTLDTVGSLSEKFKQNVAKGLNTQVEYLNITHASPITWTQSCTKASIAKRTCKPGKTNGWKFVAMNNSTLMATVDGNMQFLNEYLGKVNTGKLPNTIGKDILQGIALRLGQIPPEAKIIDYKFIKWNECYGGGPSVPPRGICPNIDRSDWKVTVKPNPQTTWIYYGSGFDAPQSLNQQAKSTVLKDIERRTHIPEKEMQILWVDQVTLNACLDTTSPFLSCRQTVLPAWQIQVLARGDRWSYYTGLFGEKIRLLNKGAWLPPP